MPFGNFSRRKKKERHRVEDNNAERDRLVLARIFISPKLHEKRGKRMLVVPSYWNRSPLLKDNTPGELNLRRRELYAIPLLNTRAKNSVINMTAGYRIIPKTYQAKNIVLTQRTRTHNLHECLTKGFIVFFRYLSTKKKTWCFYSIRGNRWSTLIFFIISFTTMYFRFSANIIYRNVLR